MPEQSSQKHCKSCNTFKPSQDFYKRKKSKDGRYYECRLCNLARVKAYYQTPRGKMLDKIRTDRYAQTAKGKANQLKHANAYHAKHPLERKAHAFLNDSIKAGKLTKPEECSKCFRRKPEINRIEGHHHLGYAREHWLTVTWVCSSCHKTIEKQIKQNSRDRQQIIQTPCQESC